MLDDLLLQMIEKRNHRFFWAANEYILKKKATQSSTRGRMQKDDRPFSVRDHL